MSPAGHVVHRLTSVLNLSQDSSMVYRFQIWQTAWQMIKDFWFSGVGRGSAAFQLVYNKYYVVYGMRAYHTHNLYIELLVEYGVFGTLIFLWLLCSYLGYALKRIARGGAAGNYDRVCQDDDRGGRGGHGQLPVHGPDGGLLV